MFRLALLSSHQKHSEVIQGKGLKGYLHILQNKEHAPCLSPARGIVLFSWAGVFAMKMMNDATPNGNTNGYLLIISTQPYSFLYFRMEGRTLPAKTYAT